MSVEAWAEEEFGAVQLGDARLRRRLLKMAARVADHPAGTVTAVIRHPAERQGAYRLLSNDRTDPKEVSRSAFAACVERCADEPYVVVAEDGSSLALTDTEGTKGLGSVGPRAAGGRGLQVMTALAISRSGVPLGLCGQAIWSRSEATTAPPNSRGVEDKETRFWLEVLNDTSARFQASGSCRPWFQMDRGADSWPVWSCALQDGHWVTVRACHDRRLRAPPGQRRYLRATVAAHPELARFELPIPGGHGRVARRAVMALRAAPVELRMTQTPSKRVAYVSMWAVSTQEVSAVPEGQEPLTWLLLTTRPVLTPADAAEVVYSYGLRWRIEEFHRAWKSGLANVEDTQLRSAAAIQTWALLLASAATRLLRLMHRSRQEPDLPATTEFSPLELHAIHLAEGRSTPPPRTPTLHQTVHRLARLGGYTGPASGGPPGLTVLSRGLAYIEPIVHVLARNQPATGLVRDL